MKIDGKIIEACAQCNEMYYYGPYCKDLYDSGNDDCEVKGTEIRDDCPLSDYFDDREEMAGMILKLYEGGPGTIYAEARAWLLKEGMIEPWECEEK